MTADLDDTTQCPVGERCENCSSPDKPAVSTAECAVGVYCLTLCPACEELPPPQPPGGWRGATERVLAHCEHLGIGIEEMSAIRDRELSGGEPQ